jgi:hypothetical protein
LQADLKLWTSPSSGASPDAISRLSGALKQGETLLRKGNSVEARQSLKAYLAITERNKEALPALKAKQG